MEKTCKKCCYKRKTWKTESGEKKTEKRDIFNKQGGGVYLTFGRKDCRYAFDPADIYSDYIIINWSDFDNDAIVELI